MTPVQQVAAMSVPGGWLRPEEVNALRSALVDERDRERKRVERAELHASVAVSVDYAAIQTRAAAGHRVILERLDAAIKVFAGIYDGARVEALPSAQDDAEHEHACKEKVGGEDVCSCGHQRFWHGDWCAEGDCACEAFVQGET